MVASPYRTRDEPSPLEEADVLGRRIERDREGARQLCDTRIGLSQPRENRASSTVRHRSEHFVQPRVPIFTHTGEYRNMRGGRQGDLELQLRSQSLSLANIVPDGVMQSPGAFQ